MRGLKTWEELRRNSCSHEFCSHLDENIFNIKPASNPGSGEIALNGSRNEYYVFMKQNTENEAFNYSLSIENRSQILG